MKQLSEYLKPALGTAFFVALFAGYYWYEHRPHREKPETTGQATVVVAKTVNACFSDMVRVTGFIVPKREAVIGADQEGSKVIDTTHDARGGIRRRRECKNCGKRYSTYERPVLAAPLIIKTAPMPIGAAIAHLGFMQPAPRPHCSPARPPMPHPLPARGLRGRAQ